MIELDKLNQVMQLLTQKDSYAKLMKTAVSISAGKEVEMSDVEVTIQVPTEILKILQMFSDAVGVELETITSHMANQGLMQQIQDSVKLPKQDPSSTTVIPQLREVKEDLGIDMSKLNEQLSKLETIASQVQGIQKVVNGIQQTRITKKD